MSDGQVATAPLCRFHDLIRSAEAKVSDSTSHAVGTLI